MNAAPLIAFPYVVIERCFPDADLPELIDGLVIGRAYVKDWMFEMRTAKNQGFERPATRTDLLNDWHVTIPGGCRAVVGLGFRARVPEGYEVQARSLREFTQGIECSLSVGATSRQWCVLVWNRSSEPFELQHLAPICYLHTAPNDTWRFPWREGSVPA